MKHSLKLSLFVLFLIPFVLVFSCKEENSDKIPSDKTAVVETVAAVVIDKYNAFCSGVIGTDNGYTVTERGFCWSASNISPTILDDKIIIGAGAGSFIDTIYAFKAGTIYFIRAFAINAAGTAYGSTLSFETLPGELAAVNTKQLELVTINSAKCGGGISYNSGSEITARGVIWGSDESITIENNIGKTIDGSGPGDFNSLISGLSVDTWYYVKAYATNASGTSYGNVREYKTPSLPTVSTNSCTEVEGNSVYVDASLSDFGGLPLLAYGVCYSTIPNPTISDKRTFTFGVSIEGITPNTIYYARAYATNLVGTAYGNEISFHSGFLIGSTYAGGVVYYNDGTGHGYVFTDQAWEAKWGCPYRVGTENDFGAGQANTNNIVGNCSESGVAARVCYDLDHNTYTNWFLPSLDELMYIARISQSQKMGNTQPGEYWSSSEDSSNSDYAYIVVFNSDGTYSYTSKWKNYLKKFLAARYF